MLLLTLIQQLVVKLKKARPCLIVSPNEINDNIKTVIVAPITSKSKKYPTRIEIKLNNKKGWIFIDQIKTIDKRRVCKKVGQLTKKKITEVKRIIKETLVD